MIGEIDRSSWFDRYMCTICTWVELNAENGELRAGNVRSCRKFIERTNEHKKSTDYKRCFKDAKEMMMIAYSQSFFRVNAGNEETTDNSTKKQIVISLQYTNNSGTPLEHIVAALEASSSTGEALPNKVGLLETMEQLVGQALGWCSNLGGDIMRSSQSHKGHVSAGNVHVVLDTQFTTCQHCS